MVKTVKDKGEEADPGIMSCPFVVSLCVALCSHLCSVCSILSRKPLILKTLLRSCDLLERIAEPKSNSRKDRACLYLTMGFLQQAPHPISCLSLSLSLYFCDSLILNAHHFLCSVPSSPLKAEEYPSLLVKPFGSQEKALIFPDRWNIPGIFVGVVGVTKLPSLGFFSMVLLENQQRCTIKGVTSSVKESSQQSQRAQGSTVMSLKC